MNSEGQRIHQQISETLKQQAVLQRQHARLVSENQALRIAGAKITEEKLLLQKLHQQKMQARQQQTKTVSVRAGGAAGGAIPVSIPVKPRIPNQPVAVRGNVRGASVPPPSKPISLVYSNSVLLRHDQVPVHPSRLAGTLLEKQGQFATSLQQLSQNNPPIVRGAGASVSLDEPRIAGADSRTGGSLDFGVEVLGTGVDVLVGGGGPKTKSKRATKAKRKPKAKAKRKVRTGGGYVQIMTRSAGDGGDSDDDDSDDDDDDRDDSESSSSDDEEEDDEDASDWESRSAGEADEEDRRRVRQQLKEAMGSTVAGGSTRGRVTKSARAAGSSKSFTSVQRGLDGRFVSTKSSKSVESIKSAKNAESLALSKRVRAAGSKSKINNFPSDGLTPSLKKKSTKRTGSSA